MATRKTYQAITSCAMTLVLVLDKEKKRKRIVNFTGHSIELGIKGKFTTSDPEIQTALESNEEFKKDFELIKTETIADAVAEKGTKTVTPTATDNLTPVEGQNTVQLAKAYLIEHYLDKVTPSALTTWKAVDDAAAECGIEFVR